MTRLVILESPYAGDVEANVAYARACLLDSLHRGEAPIASHLLHTQVLDDTAPEERALGPALSRYPAVSTAFYVDRGWSRGMCAARDLYDREGIAYEVRSIVDKVASMARAMGAKPALLVMLALHERHTEEELSVIQAYYQARLGET